VSIEPRDVAHLSGSLNRRLGQYALAASSAGVGLLALAQSAEAKIVYTKTHQVIGANGVYNLDLNHDGIVDFVIQQIDYCASTSCFGFQRSFLAKEALGNAVQGRIGMSNRHYAGALRANAWIGARQRFISGGHNGETMLLVREDQDFRILYTYGKWNNVKNRYLGLKFKIGGKIHYGWARLSVHNQGGTITGTLTGYAFETIPNKSIVAGKTKGSDIVMVQPASLGHLARGALLHNNKNQ
jgi:hypothetical protein